MSLDKLQVAFRPQRGAQILGWLKSDKTLHCYSRKTMLCHVAVWIQSWRNGVISWIYWQLLKVDLGRSVLHWPATYTHHSCYLPLLIYPQKHCRHLKCSTFMAVCEYFNSLLQIITIKLTE